nr:immunoglobulin heavy chain junction region [Mus musculus]NSM05463.1 immunoglobulin heavy chain junction region [Mus musculus]NSM05785.1 immunoglobulin heavy chain junction region [Mus musculus]NSM05826.1 immunoglobulin heavy chain junction region [Mus musculus]NSM06768.1 immunoglobulin heavy chain junction region [Mus musculus]
CVVTGTNAYW